MADLPPLESTLPAANSTSTEIPMPTRDVDAEVGSKDMVIGAVVLLVLAVVFFLIRNTYVNYLVGNLKRSPNSAGLAGTSLFGALFFGAAIGCAGIVSQGYWVLGVIAPLAGLSLICLIICVVVTSKK